MFQIDNATAVASRPAATSPGTAGWFTDGNPATSTPATIVPAEFLNMLMAEALAIMTAAGITPDKTNSAQILAAIRDSGVFTRKRLTANLTLYVSTTGSDSNSGLTAGAPFLTIQKAWNVLQQGYDLNGYSATIQLADGTYTAPLSANGPVPGLTGLSTVTINGNASTPANVVINISSNATAISASCGGVITIQNFKVTGAGALVIASLAGVINIGSGMIFGAAGAGYLQIGASGGGSHVNLSGSYSITGGAAFHMYAAVGGTIYSTGTITVTITGTPTFTSAFAYAQDASRINHVGTTYSGAVIGPRYLATLNGTINTNGSGASYFPGSVAGSVGTGGQYA